MSKTNVSDAGNDPIASSENTDDSSQMVKHETYLKVLGQKKAGDEKVKEMQAKLAAFEAAEEAKKEEQLRNEKRHEEIIAQLKADKAALAEKHRQTQTEIANSIKRQALEQAVGGFALPEYAQFAKLDSIPLLEDGSVDMEAVSREGTRIRETYPHLLRTAVSNLPSGAPPSSVGTPKPAPTAKELYYAEMEERTGLKLS